MTKNTVSCLQHADPHFLQLRVDFLAICDGNEAQAKILQILEAWTNFRLSKGKSPWVSMSFRQFVEESYQTISRFTVQRALKALIKRNYIKKSIPSHSVFGTAHYLLNLEVLQQALNTCALNALQQKQKRDQDEIDPTQDEIDPTQDEINPLVGRNQPTTYTTHTQTNTPSHIAAQRGFAQEEEEVSLRKDDGVTRTVTGLAAILHLPRTPELRRLVEEYAEVPDLSLLGEADRACEWIADPRRNSKRQPMTLGFFRNWVKNEVEYLRRKEAEREQAKNAAAAQGATPASAPSGLGVQTLYPTFEQLGPEYQEYMALIMRRVQAEKNNNN
ncbi:MAG TPA: hypothetical protein VKR06_03280 [Ktedonosporobacter sp.]|nr:hypothetical protein [Ktedonosporobacter sp.]